MESLFSKDFAPLWALVLALGLFLPVRQLIHVLYLRRAAGKGEAPDREEQAKLKKRAGATAALLSFAFAFLYSYYLFGN